MGQARNGDKSKAEVNLRSWKKMFGRAKMVRVKGPGPGWQKVPNVTKHPHYTYLDLVQFCPRWVVIVRVYDDEAVYCMQQYSTRIYYLLHIYHLDQQHHNNLITSVKMRRQSIKHFHLQTIAAFSNKNNIF